MTDIQESFIENAIMHGNAIQQGNHRLANKIHSQLTATYELIKKQNKIEELRELTFHSDENVKLWGATFLLKYDDNAALKVLSELTKSSQIIGLTASTTINMWKKGMLVL